MYHDSPFFTQRVSRPGVSLLSSLGGLALTRLTLSISRRFFRGLAHTTARINTNARRRLVIVPILRFRSSRASPKKGFDETAAAGWLGPLPSSSFLQQQSFGGRPLAEERITSEPRGEKVCRLAIRRSTTRPNRTHPFGKGSFLVKERALFFFSFSLSLSLPLLLSSFSFFVSRTLHGPFRVLNIRPTTVCSFPSLSNTNANIGASLCRFCFSLAIKLMRCFSPDFCVPFILSLSLLRFLSAVL